MMETHYRSQLCIEILHNTNDGDDLENWELKLVENAVNGFLNGRGEVALYHLYYQRVIK